MSKGRVALALLAIAAVGTARCDNTSCIDRSPNVGSACVPGTVQPDQNFVIEVRESCGLCSTNPQCSATVINGEVRVNLHAQLCNDGSITCDTNLCLQRLVQCTLPALPAGDWPLVMPGNQTRLIVVRSGGVSSCRLP